MIIDFPLFPICIRLNFYFYVGITYGAANAKHFRCIS